MRANGNEKDTASWARRYGQIEVPQSEEDYPRYRVEPGEAVSLAAIDPDETEHYRKKKDVARELER